MWVVVGSKEKSVLLSLDCGAGHKNRRLEPGALPPLLPVSLSSFVLPLSSSLGLEGWICETHVLNLCGKGGPSLLVPFRV